MGIAASQVLLQDTARIRNVGFLIGLAIGRASEAL